MNDYMENTHTAESDSHGGALPIKKYLLFLIVFLIPAFLYGLYGILVALDALPARIYIGEYRIRLVSIAYTPFMQFLCLIFFLVIPIIGIIATIIKYNREKRLTESSSSSTPSVASADTVEALDPIELSSERYERVETSVGIDELEVQEAEQTVTASPVEEITVEADGIPEMVDYSGLRELDMREISEPPFTEEYTLDGLADDMIAFFRSNGYNLPADTARRILSSIAAMRCLWITGKNREITAASIRLISEYFGVSTHEFRFPERELDPRELLITQNSDGVFAESGFAIDVYGANHRQNRFSFALLSGEHLGLASSALSPYLRSAEVLNRERRVSAVLARGVFPRFMSGAQMQVPSNVWYMLQTHDATGKGIPDNAIALDLGAVTACDSVSFEGARITASVSSFFELVHNAAEKHFIDEPDFRKLDEIERYIQKRVPEFKIDNKETRGIERYAAACLAMNGSMNEALDGIIAGMLIPVLADCKRDDLMGDADGIYVLIDRLLGIDNMPFTLEILRKFGVA